ncbi:uncharacterized protein LOC106674201 isoform X2 [Cimex lectularius]|uniref:Uncharacterized protein n=1 Tax=Cimex lectularius TaxID=79782 RepID=A0A8I6STI5_CIMLE|nr:uncharacterized protein LOC106674201 isoform X2 [Cimex lectularius]
MDIEGQCSSCLELKKKIEVDRKLYESKTRLCQLFKELICTKDLKIKEKVIPIDLHENKAKEVHENNTFRKKIEKLTSTIELLLKEKQESLKKEKFHNLVNQDLEHKIDHLTFINKQLISSLKETEDKLKESKCTKLKRKKKLVKNKLKKDIKEDIDSKDDVDISALNCDMERLGDEDEKKDEELTFILPEIDNSVNKSPSECDFDVLFSLGNEDVIISSNDEAESVDDLMNGTEEKMGSLLAAKPSSLVKPILKEINCDISNISESSPYNSVNSERMDSDEGISKSIQPEKSPKEQPELPAEDSNTETSEKEVEITISKNQEVSNNETEQNIISRQTSTPLSSSQEKIIFQNPFKRVLSVTSLNNITENTTVLEPLLKPSKLLVPDIVNPTVGLFSQCIKEYEKSVPKFSFKPLGSLSKLGSYSVEKGSWRRIRSFSPLKKPSTVKEKDIVNLIEGIKSIKLTKSNLKCSRRLNLNSNMKFGVTSPVFFNSITSKEKKINNKYIVECSNNYISNTNSPLQTSSSLNYYRDKDTKQPVLKNNNNFKRAVTFSYTVQRSDSIKQELNIILDDPYCTFKKFRDVASRVSSLDELLNNLTSICDKISSYPCVKAGINSDNLFLSSLDTKQTSLFEERLKCFAGPSEKDVGITDAIIFPKATVSFVSPNSNGTWSHLRTGELQQEEKETPEALHLTQKKKTFLNYDRFDGDKHSTRVPHIQTNNTKEKSTSENINSIKDCTSKNISTATKPTSFPSSSKLKKQYMCDGQTKYIDFKLGTENVNEIPQENQMGRKNIINESKNCKRTNISTATKPTSFPSSSELKKQYMCDGQTKYIDFKLGTENVNEIPRENQMGRKNITNENKNCGSETPVSTSSPELKKQPKYNTRKNNINNQQDSEIDETSRENIKQKKIDRVINNVIENHSITIRDAPSGSPSRCLELKKQPLCKIKTNQQLSETEDISQGNLNQKNSDRVIKNVMETRHSVNGVPVSTPTSSTSPELKKVLMHNNKNNIDIQQHSRKITQLNVNPRKSDRLKKNVKENHHNENINGNTPTYAMSPLELEKESRCNIGNKSNIDNQQDSETDESSQGNVKRRKSDRLIKNAMKNNSLNIRPESPASYSLSPELKKQPMSNTNSQKENQNGIESLQDSETTNLLRRKNDKVIQNVIDHPIMNISVEPLASTLSLSSELEKQPTCDASNIMNDPQDLENDTVSPENLVGKNDDQIIKTDSGSVEKAEFEFVLKDIRENYKLVDLLEPINYSPLANLKLNKNIQENKPILECNGVNLENKDTEKLPIIEKALQNGFPNNKTTLNQIANKLVNESESKQPSPNKEIKKQNGKISVYSIPSVFSIMSRYNNFSLGQSINQDESIINNTTEENDNLSKSSYDSESDGEMMISKDQEDVQTATIKPPQEENGEEKTDLILTLPTGFYSSLEEPANPPNLKDKEQDINLQQASASLKRKLDTLTEDPPTKKVCLIPTDETIICKGNALHGALKYWCEKALNKKNPPKTKQIFHRKEVLAKLKNTLNDYINAENSYVILESVSSELQSKANSQLAQFMSEFLLNDVDIKEDANNKKSFDLTQLQKKLLMLIITISQNKNEFLDIFLSRIENEVSSFHSEKNTQVEVLVSQVHIYTLICKKYGFVSRARAFLYDVLYTRSIKAYAIVSKMLLVWPKMLPNYQNTKECLLTHTIILLLIKIPTFWQIHDHIIKKFGIGPLKMMLKNKLGYSVNVLYEYDELFAKILENIQIKGNDLALILICKCQGFKWASAMIERKVFPLIQEELRERKNEELLAQILVNTGKICRGFPHLESAYFVIKVIELFDAVLKESSSMLVCDATVEALSLLKKHNLTLVARVVSNWRPRNKLLSINCLEHIKKILNVKNVKYWNYFIDSYSSKE